MASESDSARLDRLEIVSLKLGRAIAGLGEVLLENDIILKDSAAREHVLAVIQNLYDAVEMLVEEDAGNGQS